MVKIVKSICGCLRLIDFAPLVGAITVVDGDLMPSSSIGIYGLLLGRNAYIINNIFSNKADFLTFLNTNFVLSNNLVGTFSYSDLNLLYSNPENFQNAELLMIYKNEKRCYVVGAPDTACNSALVDQVINTGIQPDTPISLSTIRASITDVEVLEMFVETQKVTEDDSTTRGYGQSIQNANIYVITQQLPVVEGNYLITSNGSFLVTSDDNNITLN